MSDRSRADLDVQELLHPAQAFESPAQVVNDPDLTLNEKRAILASWASDACAVEAVPALRSARCGSLVPFDDIMEALRSLDAQAAQLSTGNSLRRGRLARGRGHSGSGASLQ